jgi:hypothetical protein
LLEAGKQTCPNRVPRAGKCFITGKNFREAGSQGSSAVLMKRYFLVLSIGSGTLLLAAFALGVCFLFERSQGHVAPAYDQPLTNDAFAYHMVIALVATLACLFTHCLVFTYLLGTGKWVKEVASAYQLDADGWPRQTRQFKIAVNRWLLGAIGVCILTSVTGAGAQTNPASWWSLVHAPLAVLVLVVNAYAFVKEYQVIVANEKVLVEVKAAADALRSSSGAVD